MTEPITDEEQKEIAELARPTAEQIADAASVPLPMAEAMLRIIAELDKLETDDQRKRVMHAAQIMMGL